MISFYTNVRNWQNYKAFIIREPNSFSSMKISKNLILNIYAYPVVTKDGKNIKSKNCPFVTPNQITQFKAEITRL